MTDPMETLAVAYATDYPSEVARLLESERAQERAQFLGLLSEDVAARVLAVMMPSLAGEAVAVLPSEFASAVTAVLDPRQAAVLMTRLAEPDRQAVLEGMPKALRAQLQVILRYEPTSAGSRMDPRAVAVPDSVVAAQALEYVRRALGGVLYYVYVVDEQMRLVGVFSLRELMVVAPDAPVTTFMRPNPERVRAYDLVELVVRHSAWRRVHALPVVDGSDRFLGALRYSAFRSAEADLGQDAAWPDPARTASALAELYALGAGGFARWAAGAFSGDPDGGGRR